jgi:hypothetical protein
MARAARVPPRVFLLSPAHCGGLRAQFLMSPTASFPLARQLQSPPGAPLGDVFTFLSGLYFRGKLAYARAFARPPRGGAGVLIITADAGLRSPDTLITVEDLRGAAQVDIHASNPRYRRALEASAAALATALGPRGEAVLLGSIATGKYVDVLTQLLGARLLFPESFIGRGDMSRGGLLLRCVRASLELPYVPVAGSPRHGARPPRLDPVR